MPDEIDNIFAGLDKFYPGSKRKRRDLKKVDVPTDLGWDAKPLIKKMPNGKDIEFFTNVALANALGRPLSTVKKWLYNGYLPVSPYRSPDIKTKDGKVIRGQRLYSRPQVNVVVELFGKAGLLDKTRLNWPNQKLTNAIAEAWIELRAQETKTTEPN